MSEENPVSAWSGVVPEFYYDLISRVPPGIFLIIVLLLEFKVVDPHTIVTTQIGGSIVAVLTLLLFTGGYSFGIFLSAMGGGGLITKTYTLTIFKKYAKIYSTLFQQFVQDSKICSSQGKEPLEIKDEDYPIIYRRMQDYLRANNFEARNVLPKMNAEASLCSNTVTALTVFLVVHYFHSAFLWLQYGVPEYEWWLVTIPIWIILWGTGKNRYSRLVAREYSFLGIVYEKKNKRNSVHVRRRLHKKVSEN